MTNLPKALRDQLENHYSLTGLELVRKQGAQDATQKFLWRLSDHSLIESVLIPANPALYGEASDRHTLCVSTQVGCAYGCKFCASGLEGWKRNLRVEEIVGQVLAAERWNADESKVQSQELGAGSHPASSLQDHPSLITNHASRNPQPSTLNPQPRLVSNLVIMGMGEPLANYENLLKALRILNAPWGGGLGARMITSEYVLIAGVNDGLDQVKPLAALARRLKAKVNLIPYNRVEDLPWERPTEEAQEAFLKALEKQKVTATLRREKGGDIDAACGQLRLKTERELAKQEAVVAEDGKGGADL